MVCRDTGELLEQLPRGAGALLLAEEVFSGSVMRSLAEYVANQPTWSDIPILLLTCSGADSPDVRRAVDRQGNVTLMERPVGTIALISVARSAIGARERQYQVRDADQRKDEFLATLAHELRNPLAPISPPWAFLNGRDNGIGLEPTSLTRIFDFFAQTPVPGEAPTGLGIGLSLAGNSRRCTAASCTPSATASVTAVSLC